jgi:hypothetical protein
MTSYAPLVYIQSDLGEGQTLSQWRSALEAERRVTRRRPLRLPSLRLRLAH